ncbi:MAG: protein kinase [Xenococcus sp. MO_188.B8]|nr:protein kinase [Xenococcus sp. MO_188.B8]
MSDNSSESFPQQTEKIVDESGRLSREATDGAYEFRGKTTESAPRLPLTSSSLNHSQTEKTLVAPDGIQPSQTHWIKKDSLEGKTIGDNNRYLLQTLLGQGGMSKVYQALDNKFEEKVVAIKLMTIYSYANYKNLINRFTTEIKVISSLKHPNIIQIFDYGVTPEKWPFSGSPFYVMEYFTGETLQDRLTKNTTLSLDSLFNIMGQVCAGLKEAHQKGIVHRDLKPDNIFLVAGGAFGEIVKIIDFGIAKNIGSDDQNYTKTQPGSFIGTYRYASPEQCRGLSNIDQRSDIYSLGIILYEAICGKNPYDLDKESSPTEGDWIACHIRVPPKLLSEQPGCENINSKLEDLVMKCLAKSPDNRFLNIEELQDALANSFSRQNYNTEQDTKTKDYLGKNSYCVETKDEVKLTSNPTVREPEEQPTLAAPTIRETEEQVTLPESTVRETEEQLTLSAPTVPETNKKSISNTLEFAETDEKLAVPPTRSISSSKVRKSSKRFGVITGIATILMMVFGIGGYLLFVNQSEKISQDKRKIIAIVPESNTNTNTNTQKSLETNDMTPLLESLETQYRQENYEDCYQLAIKYLERDNSVINQWVGNCGLEVAKSKANTNNYRDAITIAQTIPNTIPKYQEVKDNINTWTEEVLDYATKIYKEEGKLEEAIKITNIIRENNNFKTKIADLISQWQQEEEKYQGIIEQAQSLLDQAQWDAAKKEVEKIPSDFAFLRRKAQPILNEANQQINQIAAAEQRRLEEEQRLRAEAEAEQRRLEEEQRLKAKAEQRRLEEEQRLQEEAEAEQRRLEEEQRLQEEAAAEQRRLEEEQRLKEEAAAEQRRLEEEQRLKEEAEAEQRRLEEEQRLKEEAEAEQRRLEEEQRLRAEAQKRRLEEEQLSIFSVNGEEVPTHIQSIIRGIAARQELKLSNCQVAPVRVMVNQLYGFCAHSNYRYNAGKYHINVPNLE